MWLGWWGLMWGRVRVRGAPADALRAKIAAQEEEMKKLRRELDAVRMKAASSSVGDAVGSAVDVKGVKVLVSGWMGWRRRRCGIWWISFVGSWGVGWLCWGAAADGKVSLIVGVTKDLTGKVQAGKIVGQLAALVGGKGGGRPDLAEAGGSDVAGLDGALGKAAGVVEGLLG